MFYDDNHLAVRGSLSLAALINPALDIAAGPSRSEVAVSARKRRGRSVRQNDRVLD